MKIKVKIREYIGYIIMSIVIIIAWFSLTGIIYHYSNNGKVELLSSTMIILTYFVYKVTHKKVDKNVQNKQDI